jgi:hypothetical protein
VGLFCEIPRSAREAGPRNHVPEQHGWASVWVDVHWENHPIRSRPFQIFLLRTYYWETGLGPGAQAIHATQEFLEAKALFDGPEALIHLRVASPRGKLPGPVRPRVAGSRDRCRRLAHSR